MHKDGSDCGVAHKTAKREKRRSVTPGDAYGTGFIVRRAINGAKIAHCQE
ncbi:hypothetical protein JCM17846_18260 [Iodidimonas nitroreducens]|uniref:Uncharacterized protein n=1 Tax=Iodidimonas nitroreducens TaxID=1236968 RepID=A0A5A7N8Q6_9PROT|nr:hypothetical protein JCM17846_18260 [Iodidimonas nitroreducens]